MYRAARAAKKCVNNYILGWMITFLGPLKYHNEVHLCLLPFVASLTQCRGFEWKILLSILDSQSARQAGAPPFLSSAAMRGSHSAETLSINASHIYLMLIAIIVEVLCCCATTLLVQQSTIVCCSVDAVHWRFGWEGRGHCGRLGRSLIQTTRRLHSPTLCINTSFLCILKKNYEFWCTHIFWEKCSILYQ